MFLMILLLLLLLPRFIFYEDEVVVYDGVKMSLPCIHCDLKEKNWLNNNMHTGQMNDSLTHYYYYFFFVIISLFFQIRIIYSNLSKIAYTNCNNKQQTNIYHLRHAMINTLFVGY